MLNKMVALQETRDSTSSWNAGEIWKEFQMVAADTTNECTPFGEVFYLKMVEFLSEVLHKLREEKCNKLEETDKDMGEYMLCDMCNDLYIEPITLLCGHTYCRKCLKKRESELYIELCHKCDKNSAKHCKWFFRRRTVVDKYKNNIILNTVIYENFPNELTAIHMRLEGNYFFTQKNYGMATEKYQAAVSLCPSSFMSWSNLAQVKSMQNNFEEALFAAQNSTSIYPSWPKGYYREAIAYKGLLNPLASVLSFFKYLILEPSSVSIKELLAQCLSKLVESEYLSGQLPIQENVESKCGTNKETLEGICQETLKREYLDRLMILVLQSGIEFCLLYNPGCSRFSSKLNTQHSVDKLKSYLSCPLCCRVFYQVTTTPCGHTYCTICLERSLDYSNSCSICRYPLDELVTLKPKPIDQVLDTLVKRYFGKEYEETKNALLHESEVLQYENDEIATIPVFVCMSVFPTYECPLHVFEPRYKLMMRRCLLSSQKVFGMCTYEEFNGFSEYGTLLKIRDSRLLDDGRLLVDSIGGKRFKVLERGSRDGYATAKVQFLKDVQTSSNLNTDELTTLQDAVYQESQSFLKIIPSVVIHTVQLKYGNLPAVEEVDEEHGPKWIWYMIGLLVQTDNQDTINALKCENIEQRLLLIRQNIIKMRSLLNAS